VVYLWHIQYIDYVESKNGWWIQTGKDLEEGGYGLIVAYKWSVFWELRRLNGRTVMHNYGTQSTKKNAGISGIYSLEMKAAKTY
jgi:hypothetical protein